MEWRKKGGMNKGQLSRVSTTSLGLLAFLGERPGASRYEGSRQTHVSTGRNHIVSLGMRVRDYCTGLVEV